MGARLGAVLVGALVGALVLASGSATAAGFPFRDTVDGITCRHFDLASAIAWPAGQAEWADADGKLGGARAFDVQTVSRAMTQRVLRWDVSALVRGWASGQWHNDGLLLRSQQPRGGGAAFHAREAEDLALRPSLRIVMADGKTRFVGAAADARLDCSSHGGLGPVEPLMVGDKSSTALRFDLPDWVGRGGAAVRSAELVLVRQPTQPWGDALLGVHRLVAPWRQALPAPGAGLAAGVRADRGLDTHPEVYLADRFDAERPAAGWSLGMKTDWAVLARDEARLFWPLDGNALRATVPANDHLGLDLRYVFKARGQPEPDEVFVRYYLRLAKNWTAAPTAGKLPGFAGTYGRAAWGGRAWDGQQGWSARGSYVSAAPGHPAAGRVMLGSYVYHRDSPSNFGEVWSWGAGDGAALLQPDRWYCIEQQIRLNRIGHDDGLLRAWIDGVPVFERTGLHLRDKPSIRVEHIWMNVYVGGQETSPVDMHLFIDHVVVAKKYIGPMTP